MFSDRYIYLFVPAVATPNPLTAVSGLSTLLGGGVNLTLNLSSAFPAGGAGNPLITGQLLEHVRALLRNSGFADQSSSDVCQAIATLINYGIIGLGLGLGGAMGGANPAQSSAAQLLPPLLAANSAAAESFHSAVAGVTNGNNGPFGPIGTTVASGLNLSQSLGNQNAQRHMDRFAAPQAAEHAFDPFRRQSADGGLQLNANSFGLGTHIRKSPTIVDLDVSAGGAGGNAGSEPGSKKVEVEVGEHIVGAILGPGGKSLVEIQQMSGTVIQISKKGFYAPGTRNRIVTISGHINGVTRAQLLIEQRIADEEGKRARQNGIITPMN